ncbi:hypothetical protein FN846DRAFT_893591 [Sphaerosporella brunnea]|uniref:Uncharacterized protein n=1 Tax=Sphaerosporella brunnea TaxID=1250544 RepID=A0A5J5ELZ7_9PEZI|nr:hypothetical protein FN846DRAFT_893591 [Sphaerosporella brunnea]
MGLGSRALLSPTSPSLLLSIGSALALGETSPSELDSNADLDLCYKEVYNELVRKDISPKGGDKRVRAEDGKPRLAYDHSLRGKGEKFVLITGQPSIGKTWFLSYVLVRRLLASRSAKRQSGSTLLPMSTCIRTSMQE